MLAEFSSSPLEATSSRSSYLTGFTKEALRFAAENSEGYLARADITPPASLVDAVFPALNEWVEVDGVWPAAVAEYVKDQDTKGK